MYFYLIYIVSAIVGFTIPFLLVKFISWLIRRPKTYTYNENDVWLINEFARCNVIVFGKKGTGKDLLFSHVIALRDEEHYSNIYYDEHTEVVDLKDVSLGDITFEKLVNGTYEKIEPSFSEGADIYISDAGVYLPCQYDKLLSDLYPSMPVLYALSRQLYSNNIHCNVQSLGRLWIKLREQADSFIRTLETKDCGEFLKVTTICYENLESASKGLLPNSDPQFVATHGQVVRRVFKIPKGEITYDTRYFKSIIFDKPYNPMEGL